MNFGFRISDFGLEAHAGATRDPGSSKLGIDRLGNPQSGIRNPQFL
jgi:hypothetical protein